MTDDELFESAPHIRVIQDPVVREEIKNAGVIFGVDSATGAPSIFYGREMLKEIAKGHAAEWGPQKILAFKYDSNHGDELEYFYAAVEVLKGECCYDK
jgi:hypothetical protein